MKRQTEAAGINVSANIYHSITNLMFWLFPLDHCFNDRVNQQPFLGKSVFDKNLLFSFDYDFKNNLRTLAYQICNTAQKMKFPIKDFFRKCDQIRRKLRIWSHLRKKTLMENFIFCAV